MADPSQQQSAPSRRWWTHLWRWLWRGFGVLWSLIVAGIVVNVASTWLTSDKGLSPDSPVGLALRNLPFTIALGVILLLLTLLVGVLYHQSAAYNSQSASSLPLPPQQSRNVLIRMLRQEYTSRLTHSLQGAALMVLGLHERTDLTISSAQLVFRHSNVVGEHPLPPGTSIVQVYDDAGQGLLIVGEPGAGKTTLLLDLARELLIRAEGDSIRPIPVILNLSSWAINKLPLATWLIDQVQLVYGVPPRLSKALLEHDQWLLLLDGLDEVVAVARNACIEAINTYRGEHFAPLVVCSRSHEYLAQVARLALPEAVAVQPLTHEQVMEYLKRIGKPIIAVQEALHSNAILQQLITSPLILNVVILTYRDKTLSDLPHSATAKEQQHYIFASYIERMLERPISGEQFTRHQTRKWLTWLAQEMQQRQLTEFYLERLQPTWLATKQAQTFYTWFITLLIALSAGLVFGFLFGLVAGALFGVFIGLGSGVAIALLSMSGGKHPRLTEVLASSKGLRQALRSTSAEQWKIRIRALLYRSWRFAWRNLRRVLNGPRKIQLVEVLNWSWKGFLQNLFLGLFLGLLIGPLAELAFRLLDNRTPNILVVMLCLGLIYGLIFGMFGGFSEMQIDDHTRIQPNQGILRSGWNALRIGLIATLFLGLLLDLSLVLLYGLRFSLDGPLLITLIRTLLVGLSGGLFFGIIIGLSYGGIAYFEHYTLRYLLRRSGCMPWRYVRFLEEASDRILLQRVGGGYRFIHPLFLDYFAANGETMPAGSTQQLPLQET